MSVGPSMRPPRMPRPAGLPRFRLMAESGTHYHVKPLGSESILAIAKKGLSPEHEKRIKMFADGGEGAEMIQRNGQWLRQIRDAAGKVTESPVTKEQLAQIAKMAGANGSTPTQAKTDSPFAAGMAAGEGLVNKASAKPAATEALPAPAQTAAPAASAPGPSLRGGMPYEKVVHGPLWPLLHPEDAKRVSAYNAMVDEKNDAYLADERRKLDDEYNSKRSDPLTALREGTAGATSIDAPPPVNTRPVPASIENHDDLGDMSEADIQRANDADAAKVRARAGTPRVAPAPQLTPSQRATFDARQAQLQVPPKVDLSVDPAKRSAAESQANADLGNLRSQWATDDAAGDAADDSAKQAWENTPIPAPAPQTPVNDNAITTQDNADGDDSDPANTTSVIAEAKGGQIKRPKDLPHFKLTEHPNHLIADFGTHKRKIDKKAHSPVVIAMFKQFADGGEISPAQSDSPPQSADEDDGAASVASMTVHKEHPKHFEVSFGKGKPFKVAKKAMHPKKMAAFQALAKGGDVRMLASGAKPSDAPTEGEIDKAYQDAPQEAAYKGKLTADERAVADAPPVSTNFDMDAGSKPTATDEHDVKTFPAGTSQKAIDAEASRIRAETDAADRAKRGTDSSDMSGMTDEQIRKEAGWSDDHFVTDEYGKNTPATREQSLALDAEVAAARNQPTAEQQRILEAADPSQPSSDEVLQAAGEPPHESEPDAALLEHRSPLAREAMVAGAMGAADARPAGQPKSPEDDRRDQILAYLKMHPEALNNPAFAPPHVAGGANAGTPWDAQIGEDRKAQADAAQQVTNQQKIAADQRAAQIAQHVTDQQNWSNNFQTFLKGREDASNAMIDRVNRREIDPNRYWHNIGPAGQTAMALAQAMGTFGSALTKTPNYAYQMVSKAVDDDIASQQANLGKDQSLLGTYLAQTRDLTAAKAMTRAQMLDVQARQLEILDSQKDSAMQNPMAQANIAKLRQEATTEKMKAAASYANTMQTRAETERSAQQAPLRDQLLRAQIGEAEANKLKREADAGKADRQAGAIAGGVGTPGTINGLPVPKDEDFWGGHDLSDVNIGSKDFIAAYGRKYPVKLPNGLSAIADSPKAKADADAILIASRNMLDDIQTIKNLQKQNGRTFWGSGADASSVAAQRKALSDLNHLEDVKRLSGVDMSHVLLPQLPQPGQWLQGRVQPLLNSLTGQVRAHQVAVLSQLTDWHPPKSYAGR